MSDHERVRVLGGRRLIVHAATVTSQLLNERHVVRRDLRRHGHTIPLSELALLFIALIGQILEKVGRFILGCLVHGGAPPIIRKRRLNSVLAGQVFAGLGEAAWISDLNTLNYISR